MIFQRLMRRFRAWWHAPVTSKDRWTGVVVGGMGGFWIGFFGCGALGATPMGLGQVIVWGLVASVCCAVVGYRHPKPVTAILFPFAISGFSS